MDHLIDDVSRALSNQYGFKPKGVDNKYLRGKCPSCGFPEAWTESARPWVVFCQRGNECGLPHTVRAMFPDIFENFSERYPATDAEPLAPAKAYLTYNRGFDLERLDTTLWTMGSKKTESSYAETVRFPLWDGSYWERIIDAKKSRDMPDGRKAHFSYGVDIAGKHWAPTKYKPKKNTRIYIVEGIFHAIALDQTGKKTIAAFTTGNFPDEFVQKHKGKGVIWCLGYDNGVGGRKANQKYAERLKDMNETCEVFLCPSDSMDWDECGRAGLLEKDSFWAGCSYRGRLLMAERVEDYAYIKYCQRRYFYDVVSFKCAFYSVSIEKAILEDLHPHEGAKTDIDTPKGREIFTRHYKATRISNSEFEILYRQRDEIFKDQQFVLKINYRDGHTSENIEVPGALLTSVGAFRKALANSSRASFMGTIQNLDMLYERWMRHLKEIDVLPYVGYNQKTGTYIFPKHAVIGERLVSVNKSGYFELQKGFGIRTSNDDVDFKFGRHYHPQIAAKIIAGWGPRGLCALGAWTATLFVVQLKKHYQDWPFVELSGGTGAGKSTLIKLFWRMFGRSDNFEGIDVNKTKPAGRAAMFAQVSNLPVVISESDRADTSYGGFDWNEFKDFFGLNGLLRVRGTTEKMRTVLLKFAGSLFFVQNESIESDDAIMERIVHFHFETAAKKTREVVESLIAIPNDNLNGYITQVLTSESKYLDTLTTLEKTYNEQFQDADTLQRVSDMHARIMASVGALILFFDIPQKDLDACAEYIKSRMHDRSKRINGDPPIIKEFWAVYDHLVSAPTPGREIQLNHASEPEKVISLSLSHVEAECRRAGLTFPIMKDLRKALPHSQSRTYIDHGKSHSTLWKKTIQLWEFANVE